MDPISDLAYAIWEHKYNCPVDAETTQQIWDCAAYFNNVQHEDGAWENDIPCVAELLADQDFGPQNSPAYGGIPVHPLGLTHQDIADEAYTLWLQDQQPEAEHPVYWPEWYWYTAENILLSGERE